MLGKFTKAQTGETITWVVATIVIIVILYFSILIAGGSDALKDVLNLDKEVVYHDFRDGQKSLHGFLMSENGQVYYNLRDEGNLVFNGDLAKSIFTEIYGVKYNKVWLGTGRCESDCKEGGINGDNNDFFGSQPDDATYGIYDAFADITSVSNSVHLLDDLYVELFLVGEKDE